PRSYCRSPIGYAVFRSRPDTASRGRPSLSGTVPGRTVCAPSTFSLGGWRPSGGRVRGGGDASNGLGQGQRTTARPSLVEMNGALLLSMVALTRRPTRNPHDVFGSARRPAYVASPIWAVCQIWSAVQRSGPPGGAHAHGNWVCVCGVLRSACLSALSRE